MTGAHSRSKARFSAADERVSSKRRIPMTVRPCRSSNSTEDPTTSSSRGSTLTFTPIRLHRADQVQHPFRLEAVGGDDGALDVERAGERADLPELYRGGARRRTQAAESAGVDRGDQFGPHATVRQLAADRRRGDGVADERGSLGRRDPQREGAGTGRARTRKTIRSVHSISSSPRASVPPESTKPPANQAHRALERRDLEQLRRLVEGGLVEERFVAVVEAVDLRARRTARGSRAGPARSSAVAARRPPTRRRWPVGRRSGRRPTTSGGRAGPDAG